MKKNLFLFFIIFLEGYIVLSTELLAIRLTTPFVGSGTDTVAIIIAAVLMPLSFGYYTGGQYRGSVRKRLVRNFLISAAILAIGLSFYALSNIFETLIKDLELHNRLTLTTLYVSIFLIIPVYLLGQTVPLASNYFARSRLSEVTGKILFFSTAGSFIGAVFTTIILMNFIGVPNSAVITIAALVLLTVLMSKRPRWRPVITGTAILLLTLFLNSPYLLQKTGLINSNAYNTVQIVEIGKNRPVKYLKLNGAWSSALFKDNEELVFPYAQYIEKYFLKKFRPAGKTGEILVIGGGGYTIGLKDTWNHYSFVEIDPALKDTVEDHYLDTPLTENKTVITAPIRSFLNQHSGPEDQKYDLVVMDAARGITGIPEHLVTAQFYSQIKNVLKDDGIFIANYYISAMMDDLLSQNLDNTIRAVFPHTSRQVLGGYNPWDSAQNNHVSVLYIARKRKPENEGKRVYTDTHNRSSLDRPAKAPY